MKKSYVASLLTLLSLPSIAQLPEWVVSFGDQGFTAKQYGYHIQAASNAIYATGSVAGNTVDFDGNQITASGDRDALVLKLDSTGNVIWATRAGGPGAFGTDFEAGRLICYDDGQDILYTTGQFSSTPSSFGNHQLSAAANTANVYCGALDANGEWVWVKHIQGPQLYMRSIFIDDMGYMAVAGNSPYQAYFDATPPAVLPGGGFLARYDAIGSLIGAELILANGFIGDMKLVDGSQYIVGDVSAGGTLYNTAVPAINGARTSFVAKTDALGNVDWLATIGGSDTIITTGVGVLPNGRALSMGRFLVILKLHLPILVAMKV